MCSGDSMLSIFFVILFSAQHECECGRHVACASFGTESPTPLRSNFQVSDSYSIEARKLQTLLLNCQLVVTSSGGIFFYATVADARYSEDWPRSAQYAEREWLTKMVCEVRRLHLPSLIAFVTMSLHRHDWKSKRQT